MRQDHFYARREYDLLLQSLADYWTWGVTDSLRPIEHHGDELFVTVTVPCRLLP